jgi:hypothetical protein
MGRGVKDLFLFLASAGRETKEIGKAFPGVCPACGSSCSLQISVRYNTLRLFFIPVFRWGVEYVASAPCCGAVFSLDAEEGRAFRRGEKRDIDPAFLQGVLSPPERCHVCGTYLLPGANYCLNCGNPVRRL